LRYFLKVTGDGQSVTNSGKLFHAKALSPSDERRVAGTTRADRLVSKMTSHCVHGHCTNERRVRKRDKKVRRDVI